VRIIFTGTLQGAFALFREATISSVMSVRPSAWNNSVLTGRTVIKFDISIFFEKSFEKIQIFLKSEKNDEYFTRRPIYVCDVSLNSF
jgi:hypothetical protein